MGIAGFKGSAPELSTSPQSPDWLLHLKEHGYAVVSGVLSAEEVQKAEELLWDFMGSAASWKKHEPDTWTDESIGSMGRMHFGLINGRGIGQSDLSWYVRCNPRVQQTFADIWGTNELITSFDGINMFRPWHHGFQKTVGGWFHVDQGSSHRGFCCVQGMVSLYDQDESTGGLVVIPGSHHRHDEVCELKACGDYIEPPEGHPLLSLSSKLVACKAGDLILWDSRCLHCNAPATLTPRCKANELLRAVVYVCMTPRSFAKEEDLEKRRAGYNIRMTSSHWPHCNVMGFGWGKPGPLDYNTAPEERKRLIG